MMLSEMRKINEKKIQDRENGENLRKFQIETIDLKNMAAEGPEWRGGAVVRCLPYTWLT